MPATTSLKPSVERSRLRPGQQDAAVSRVSRQHSLGTVRKLLDLSIYVAGSPDSDNIVAKGNVGTLASFGWIYFRFSDRLSTEIHFHFLLRISPEGRETEPC